MCIMVSIGHLFYTFIFIDNIRNIGTKAVKLASATHIWSVPKNVPDILSWNKAVFPEQSYVPDIFLVTFLRNKDELRTVVCYTFFSVQPHPAKFHQNA